MVATSEIPVGAAGPIPVGETGSIPAAGAIPVGVGLELPPFRGGLVGFFGYESWRRVGPEAADVRSPG